MSVPDAVPDCKTLTSWTKSPNAVVRDGSVPLEERMLFIALLSHANLRELPLLAWPGNERLTRYMGRSERTIQRLLAALERRGWISVEHSGPRRFVTILAYEDLLHIE